MEPRQKQILSTALWESVIAFDKGEWERALRAVDRALAVAPDDLGVLSVAVCLCLETGDSGRLSPFLLSLTPILQPGSRPIGLDIAVDWLGRAAWKTRRKDIAGLAEMGTALGREENETPPLLSAIWCSEAWVALAEDDPTGIKRAYAELDAYRLAPTTQMLEPQSSDPLLLAALLEASAGTLDLAIQRFEGSLAIARYAKYMPKVAWTLAEHAQLLQRRAQGDDREKAVQLQDEALAIARDLGMKPLIDRILQRMVATGE
jgi:tetratricopeptide (TPR) repeat protein